MANQYLRPEIGFEKVIFLKYPTTIIKFMSNSEKGFTVKLHRYYRGNRPGPLLHPQIGVPSPDPPVIE